MPTGTHITAWLTRVSPEASKLGETIIILQQCMQAYKKCDISDLKPFADLWVFKTAYMCLSHWDLIFYNRCIPQLSHHNYIVEIIALNNRFLNFIFSLLLINSRK